MDHWGSPWKLESSTNSLKHPKGNKPTKLELPAAHVGSSSVTFPATPQHARPVHYTVETDTNSEQKLIGQFHAQQKNVSDEAASPGAVDGASPIIFTPDLTWSTSPKLQYAILPESDNLDPLVFLNPSSSTSTTNSVKAKELIEFFEAKSGTTRPDSANDDRIPFRDDEAGYPVGSVLESKSSNVNQAQPLLKDDDDNLPWSLSPTTKWSVHGGPLSSDHTPFDEKFQGPIFGVADSRYKEQEPEETLQDMIPPALCTPKKGNPRLTVDDSSYLEQAANKQAELKTDACVLSAGIKADAETRSQIPSLFKVNLDVVEQLYPLDHADDQPDSLDDDVLRSISAQKAWYRISRLGTMRKHNSGVDDYVRVSWIGSAVQSSASAVVARWIIQDLDGSGFRSDSDTGSGSFFKWGGCPRTLWPKVQPPLERSKVGLMLRQSEKLYTSEGTGVVKPMLNPRIVKAPGYKMTPRSPVRYFSWSQGSDLSPSTSDLSPLSASCSTLSSGDTDTLSFADIEDDKMLDWTETECGLISGESRQDSQSNSRAMAKPVNQYSGAEALFIEDATPPKSNPIGKNPANKAPESSYQADRTLLVRPPTASNPAETYDLPNDNFQIQQMAASTAKGEIVHPESLNALISTDAVQDIQESSFLRGRTHAPSHQPFTASILGPWLCTTSSPIIPQWSSSRNHTAILSADSSLLKIPAHAPAHAPKPKVDSGSISQSPRPSKASNSARAAEQDGKLAQVVGD